MKKFTALILAALMTLSFAACNRGGDGGNGGGDDASLTEVLNKKAIILGYDKNYMPMGFEDTNGTYIGFDIDLAKEIAKRLVTESGTQVTLNVLPTTPENGVSELINGSIDFLGNNLSAAGGDKDQLAYSDTILKNKQVIVVLSDSEINDKGQLEGKKVAVVPNSVSAAALDGDSGLKSKVTVVDAADVTKALEELTAKNVDAVIMDEVAARYQITKGASIRMLDKELKSDDYKLVFNKGSKALIKQTNDLLKEMAKDGTLEKLSQKWFGENIIIVK